MRASWMPWAVVLVSLATGARGATADEDPWKTYRFLAGEWAAEGGGDPGQATGGFSFAWDLKEKVLVRKNRADYPAAQGRPASSHEDLMVIYRGEGGEPTRAIYFDSEGHVINYTAAFSQDQRTLTFISDAAQAGPRFRLSYARGEGDVLKIRFEIAPPGKPDAFKTYLEGTARHREGQGRSGK